jgi:hypothetical protein
MVEIDVHIRMSAEMKHNNPFINIHTTADGVSNMQPLVFNMASVTWNQGRRERPIMDDDDKFFIDVYGTRMEINGKAFMYEHGGYAPVLNTWNSMNNIPGKLKDRGQKNKYMKQLQSLLKSPYVIPTFGSTNKDGIGRTLTPVLPFFEEFKKSKPDDLMAIMAFDLAVIGSSRAVSGTKFSVVFNKLFGGVDTQDKFNAMLSELSSALENVKGYMSDGREYLDSVMDVVPDARDIKKASMKRKSTGAINKIMDDLDFIKIDKDKYPLTHEAVFSGDIPKGTFFRKSGDSYFVYNDNWDIWEAILAEHRDVAISIAAEASRRTTFEKDIMSYFYFVMHKLPEYLERQTGKKWKCIPKLVSAEKELEPPAEGGNGVTKTRSALTPIVDNDKCEVVVPYVSMRLSGYNTSYCYGLDYNVLERGMSFMGNSVTRDVEKNLNGRDDYGLMLYTLTGSAQAQGYPTFLIIFEHLDHGTRVHFHRTHPMRSKGGDYNPIHGWVMGCYKWMVGNVNFDRIKAQQGDLVFVSVDLGSDKQFDLAVSQEVNAYDNHKFATPVKFIPYEGKTNILGYFRIEKDTMLNHHEHKPRIIPAGDYELRQCRSWEANPKGIWSLRID